VLEWESDAKAPLRFTAFVLIVHGAKIISKMMIFHPIPKKAICKKCIFQILISLLIYYLRSNNLTTKFSKQELLKDLTILKI
jgi:hypothetical protein